MRIPFIAGNHKMNKTLSEAVDYTKNLIDKVKDVNPSEVEIMFAPPFMSLAKLSEMLSGSNIKLGAQNCHFEEKGAFTGEISVQMLKDVGTDYVILGHSERRHVFNETDEEINKKVHAVLNAGMKVVLCVGEKEEQRETEITDCVNEIQLKNSLKGVSVEKMKDVVIAYEPVWAIGTGKTATPDDAQKAHSYIRKVLADMYDKNVSEDTRILYGGSVKPENIKNLMAENDIDGALVGGASLKFDSFERIIKFKS